MLLDEVLAQAEAMDRRAVAVYAGLALRFAGHPAGAFFDAMAQEEKEHARYWARLRNKLEGVSAGAVFDEPGTVRMEVARIAERIEGAISSLSEQPSLQDAFNAAFRLEFYMLHPCFEELLRFGSSIDPKGEDLHESYGLHVQAFIEALSLYGARSPELLLAAEILGRLWDDNRRLSRESRTDPLTGLRNRRALMADASLLVAVASRTGQRVGVLMLDIDHFKQVNDAHGHARGDQVLREVSSLLNRSVRRADVLGRYGGEEFAVVALAPDGAPADVFVTVAEKLRQAVATATPGDLRLTISVGVADGPSGGVPEELLATLVGRADECLYAAKAAGRDRVRAAPRAE